MGSLKDIMEQKGAVKQDKPEMANQMKIRMIHYSKLLVNPENIRQASPEEIEALADSIELTGKILHNLDVVQIEPDSYTITAGNKRRMAVQYLVEQRGLEKYAFLPCVVETQDDVKSRLFMILSNFMQKDATDYEKMQEITELNQLLPAALGDASLSGRALRKLIAQKTGMSETRIANLNSIDRNLVPEGKEKFKSGELNVSTATELAGLPEEKQKELIAKDNLKVSDVKEAKNEYHPTERVYSNAGNMSSDDALWCMHRIRDLFEHTRLKEYKPFMFYLISNTDEAEPLDNLANEMSEKLLYHSRLRNEQTMDSQLVFTQTRAILHGGEKLSRRIVLTHAVLLDLFCEEYANDIFEFMGDDSVSESDTGYQIQMDDYAGDEAVGEMVTEHRIDARIRDKCQYMDKLTCTLSNTLDLLREDDPERYQKCCGCCMACTDSAGCGYACNRKDMDIVRQRAGLGAETEQVDQETGKRIAQMELNDAAQDYYRLVVIKKMINGDVHKEYQIYRALCDKENIFGDDMNDTIRQIEEIFDGCSVDFVVPDMTEKQLKAEFTDGELRIRLTREVNDVLYVWEDTMIAAVLGTLLLLTISDGGFLSKEKAEHFRFRYDGDSEHRSVLWPSEISAIIDSAPQWPIWIDLPQIGQKYRRLDMDEKTMIVYHEKGYLRFEGEEPVPLTAWYLIRPDSCYWQHKDSIEMCESFKDEVRGYLEEYKRPTAAGTVSGAEEGGESNEAESSGEAGETAESIL